MGPVWINPTKQICGIHDTREPNLIGRSARTRAFDWPTVMSKLTDMLKAGVIVEWPNTASAGPQ
jgi:hypothetical protein